MKKLTLLLLLVSSFLSAQVEYGKITYLRSSEMTMTFGNDDKEDPGKAAQNKQIREMMAKMQSSGAFNKTFFATFSPTEFNCMEEYKDPAEMTTDLGGGTTIMIMSSDEDPMHYYTDTKTGDVLNSDFIFDKGFLVSGNKARLDWTLTKEKVAPSEMTAGLDLLLATTITAEGDTLIAGYAPSLPANVGPLNYYGLPGAIITLEIPNGKNKTVYRATNIEVSSTPLEIAKPTEGKAIKLDKFLEQKAKKEGMMHRSSSFIEGH